MEPEYICIGRIRDLKQTEYDADASKRMANYLAKFEQYNIKGLYGSDILSLANLQYDYNVTQTGETGYSEIEISVELNNDIKVMDTIYFSAGKQDINEILKGNRKLENAIAMYEEVEAAEDNNKLYKKKTVKYFSQKSYREIAEIYGIDYPQTDDDGYVMSDEEVGNYIVDNKNRRNKKINFSN